MIPNSVFPVRQSDNNMWYEKLDLYLTTTDDNSASLRIVNLVSSENSDFEEYKILREHSFDSNEKRYEVPSYFFNGTAQNSSGATKDRSSPNLGSGMGMDHRNGPFSFDLTHPDDNSTIILTTLDQNLIFMDKFLQISFLVNGQRVFGYGERVSNFFLEDGNYTLYAQEHTYKVDEGKGAEQLNGVHPFVGVKLNSNGYLGIVFKNSNAQVL